MITVTDEMVALAVKQAVKDKILPKYAGMDDYLHHYESVKRMIEAAMSESEDIPEIFPGTMKKLDEILDIKTK